MGQRNAQVEHPPRAMRGTGSFSLAKGVLVVCSEWCPDRRQYGGICTCEDMRHESPREGSHDDRFAGKLLTRASSHGHLRRRCCGLSPNPAFSSCSRRLACVCPARVSFFRVCVSRVFLATFFRVSSACSPCIYIIGGGVLLDPGFNFIWLIGSVGGVSFFLYLVSAAAVVGTAVHTWKGNLVRSMRSLSSQLVRRGSGRCCFNNFTFDLSNARLAAHIIALRRSTLPIF